MRSAEIGQQKTTPHPRTNRSASTPVGSVAQHAAASDEAAGAAMGGCCRTGAAARFVFGCPPAAIPCPYTHASVDCDEVIYYVRGNFTSRKGVGPKAVSLHPAGVPHGRSEEHTSELQSL